MTNADVLIQRLIDNKLVTTRFDKFLNQQMIEITPLGIEIHSVLNKLKTTSKESEETNQYAGEKLAEEENDAPV